ncbi:glycosyltransferase family 2 protein [Xanthomarina gelatinilytica]|uniref:glycosyltransferase family 2 protein n=1 Tax=Xanthomarina gelatinilytica TaxID=1137281 RepID=UPI003AA95EEA
MSNPLVSVVVSTYNHHKYIDDCLKGILMQQTTFHFEIILGEDESNDGTREICLTYAEKHPDKIKLFLRSRKDVIYISGNPTGRYNFLENLKASTGKYIALCEGDDYWTDPLKLQKQVDFMEACPNFSLTFHNAIVVKDEKQIKQNMHENLDKDVFYTQDLLKQWFIPTASILFRNYKDFVLPDWFANCSSGDIALLLLLSLNGPFKYYNEPMSVYRLQQAGISNKHTGYDKVFSMIYLYKCFNFFTNNKFEAEIQNAMIYEIRKHLPNNTKAELKKLKQDLFIKSYLKIKKLF